MTLLDRITDGLTKVLPAKQHSSTSMSGAMGGGGHGMVPFQDDDGQLAFLLFVPVLWVIWIWMIVSKPTIIFHTSQIVFNFFAMACFAGVASFQAKWGVGPSGLTGFAVFISVSGMFLSSFMLLVPVIYEKYDKFVRIARALKEVRVGFILTGTGTTFSLLIAFIVTISAWTQPGCKDPNNDPHAKEKGDEFKKGLRGWCTTKKAGAIFFWLAFAFWAASLTMLILDWRAGKLTAPRDPPFTRPQTATQGDLDYDPDDPDDEESSYHHVTHPTANNTNPGPTTYDNSNTLDSPFADAKGYNPPYASPAPAASRPSMDAYGAFSDPAPSGFGSSSPSGRPGPPMIPEPDLGPKVSRTMQYADPYAAVRATVAGGRTSPSSPGSGPVPSYESYQGYR